MSHRILILSTQIFTSPPRDYAGLELIVYELAKGLAERGHHVSCLCPDGSSIPGVEVLAFVKPGNENMEGEAFSKIQGRICSGEWTHIIDHSWQALPWSLKPERPHLRLMKVVHGMKPYATLPSNISQLSLVGVSQDHARRLAGYYGVSCEYAYNGLDFSNYALVEEKQRYIVYLNRVMAEKGAMEFVELAGRWLAEGKIERAYLCGEDQFVSDLSYTMEVMKRCDGQRLLYMGRVPQSLKIELLSHASALVAPLPTHWAEPFGLFAIEALACGTPVLATASGALPELLTEGTGYVARDLKELLDSYDRIKETSPVACRKRADEFSMGAMCDGYERLLQRLDAEGGW